MPSTAAGGEAEAAEGSVALGLKLEGVGRRSLDAAHQIGHGGLAAGQPLALDADDPIARHQASGGGGLAWRHAGDQYTRAGAVAGGNSHKRPLGQQHGESEQQVGEHAGGNHQAPLVQGAVAQQIGVIRWNLAVLVVIGEGDEAAQGDRPQGELHTTAAPLQQHRAKAHREATYPNALPGGSKKVAGFVNHDQASQDCQCGENTHAARILV